MAMCFFFQAFATDPDSTSTSWWEKPAHYRSDRGWLVGAGLGAGYVGTMSALYATWYSDYPMGRFHAFNDNHEWLQMDKVGHAGSVYYLSRWTSGIISWTGKSDRSSVLLGTGAAWVFLLTVETFDGFSDQWGFSAGDMVANTAGAGLFLGQELLWKEQRISFKYSYHKDPIADVRPGTFGKDFSENVLKDYNGQTYWLSCNLSSFFAQSKIPSWLNIAAGYGAAQMLTAENNQQLDNGLQDPGTRYRQFYLSPDIDWTRIKTKHRFLKTVFKVMNFIKIPAPAIEYRTSGKLVLHGIYF